MLGTLGIHLSPFQDPATGSSRFQLQKLILYSLIHTLCSHSTLQLPLKHSSLSTATFSPFLKLSSGPLLCSAESLLFNSMTLWAAAFQVPLSVGFPRQEYWSGLLCPPSGDLPNPGIKTVSPVPPALQVDSLPLSHQGSQLNPSVQFSSVTQSCLTLRPHEPQHARPPCPTLTPGAHPNSCPLSQWCHPAISSSVVPFSSNPQSFPESESFQMSRFFASGGQSIGVLASISDLPGLISFRMNWLDLLVVQGTLKSLLQHHSSKASILWCSAFFIVQLSHPYMTTGKTIALTRRTFIGKVMSLLFNMLSRLVITFLPRSKRLLI